MKLLIFNHFLLTKIGNSTWLSKPPISYVVVLFLWGSAPQPFKVCVPQSDIRPTPPTLPAGINESRPSASLELPFITLNIFPATSNPLTVSHCLKPRESWSRNPHAVSSPHMDRKSVRNNLFSGLKSHLLSGSLPEHQIRI